MEKVIIKIPGMPVREAELGPGSHKIGRSINTDLQLDHASVSGAHCELMVNNDGLFVRDLGSTNGTFLDGQAVTEAQVQPGQTLRLGEVHLLLKPQAAPTATSALKLAAASPAGESMPEAVRLVPRMLPPNPGRAARRPKNFYKSIPSAFTYPLRRNGWILLGSGTLIFGIINFLVNIRVMGFQILGMFVGTIISVAVTGYMFLYLQTVVNTSALGEDKMPSWPEYENWWESALQPYLRLLGIGAACLAPGMVGLLYFGHAGQMMFIPLLLLGLGYFPMALLAVAMDDSLMGLNPMLVIPSILRVPLEYLVSCAFFAVLACAICGVTVGIVRLFHDSFAQSFVSSLAILFLTLYFMIVAMRLLGLLYYTRKDRFGWRA